MNPNATTWLSRQDREQVIVWFAEREDELPEPVRRFVAEPLRLLTSDEQLSQKKFDQYSRQLARAFGFIPSTEKRRASGRPLASVSFSGSDKPRGKREELEYQVDRTAARLRRARTACRSSKSQLTVLKEELATMSDDDSINLPANSAWAEIYNRPLSEVVLTEKDQQEIAEEVRDFIERVQLGDGEDPRLSSSAEDLMNADVVCTDEDYVQAEAQLPDDVPESSVTKSFVEPRTRYDFSVNVTRVHVDVEKKVIKSEDGQRRVISGSVRKIGPRGFAVTWTALATLAVMVGQFAMPLNRLGKMLSSATKKFTSTSLGRMAHYVAERFLPVYLVLMDQLADSDILAGDDTSCRVLEVSSYYSKVEEGDKESPPWSDYRTVEDANRTYLDQVKRGLDLIARRMEGDREAKQEAIQSIPLKVQVGREMAFESQRKNGGGPKQALNTTVITGRADADDPRSEVVFYRSHLGSLGNLLEMILARRKPTAKKVTVQADLSTTNLVTDPKLTSRFDIELVGCSAHARRPFAQYEDHDPVFAPALLEMFGELAIHEQSLDRFGRNYENTMAVRQADSKMIWGTIRDVCQAMVLRWTKATPLGKAARYVITHFKRLTAYLDNPRLQPTNNLRERMLRTEKLIEKSSMFRKSIEGRVVLDIIRTVLQTATAAGVPPHEYLVDVLKAEPEDIVKHPERYTPHAWAKRHCADNAPA